MAKQDSGKLFGGVILVIVGLAALAGQFLDFSGFEGLGFLFLPALGAMFMVWGIVTRQAGPMVPGGILSGIGWGSYLAAGPGADFLNIGAGEEIGGVFLLAFAAGWVSITVFSAIFAKTTVWGTLVPAAILGLIGAALLFGGVMMDVLEVAGRAWPAALIVAGAYVLLKAMRKQDEAEPTVQVES